MRLSSSIRRTVAALPFQVPLTRRYLWSKKQLEGASVFMFHGLRERHDNRMIDDGLHLPVESFERICWQLKREWEVLPLSQIVDAINAGQPLPERAVALTFDDGYASNHELAFPILSRYELPATIFPATSFLDGEDWLWFNQLNFAFANTHRKSLPTCLSGLERAYRLETKEDRIAALIETQSALKSCPQEELHGRVLQIEDALDVGLSECPNKPAALLPLSWDQAGTMQASGLIEFGGHTHRHLILGGCTEATQRIEISRCYERLNAELGVPPELFAYPNGKPTDFSAVSESLLISQGFTSAVTTSSGLITEASALIRLPRQRCPISMADAERLLYSAAQERSSPSTASAPQSHPVPLFIHS